MTAKTDAFDQTDLWFHEDTELQFEGCTDALGHRLRRTLLDPVRFEVIRACRCVWQWWDDLLYRTIGKRWVQDGMDSVYYRMIAAGVKHNVAYFLAYGEVLEDDDRQDDWQDDEY